MPAFVRALSTGLIIAILLALVAVSPLGLWVEEEFGLAVLFHLRGEKEPPSDAVIVSIDKASTDTLKLPALPRDWSRAVHAELVQQLKKAGARVTVFDLLFHKEHDRAGDEQFAQAIHQAGNVLLVEAIQKENVGLAQANLTVEQILPPLPAFSRVALDSAPFPLPIRPIRINEFWTFKKELADTPTVPVLALMHFYPEEVQILLRLMRQAGYQISAFQMKRILVQIREQSARDPRLPETARALIRQELVKAGAERAYAMEAVADAVLGSGRRYINYYGPPHSIETIPYAAVIEGYGQWEPAQLAAKVAGKAVFVGFAEQAQPEQKDHFYTVYSQPDGLDLAGVEIAATAFANLLTRDTLQDWPRGAQVLFILCWGVVLAALIRWFHVAYALTAISLITGLYIYSVYFFFQEYEIWSPLILPALVQMPLTLIAGYIQRYAAVNKEREHIRNAFGLFIPEEVVKQLARDGEVVPGGKHVFGVCLTTDADQYTSLAERLPVEQLSALLNEYYAYLFKPVREHGGFISDVVGDSMLALWVSSEHDETLSSLACQAVMEIGHGVASFNRMHNSARLPTRIGLHCGDVILGNVGAVGHFEYRAVGDMVNTANRIQGMNKYLGTTQLVSADIAAAAEGFLYRDMGEFYLAGRRTPLRLLELIGPLYNAGQSDKDKVDLFAECLSMFYQQHWQRAEVLLYRYLQDFPNDGPALFYLKQCKHYEQHQWQGAVAMNEK